VRAHHAKLSERVTRLAMVRPSGIEGAVVAGFFRVLDPPYPVAVFEAAPEALEWLGEAPAGLAAELDRLVGEARGLAPTVGALRAWLAPRRSAGIEEACAALGLSARTLQRRLREGGTSWQREVQAARIADAERRMLDTDDPLTAIALDAGFASLQHFSGLFRKARGASPSSWRAQRRRGGER
jgi:AraC-like DNA-binding protein